VIEGGKTGGRVYLVDFGGVQVAGHILGSAPLCSLPTRHRLLPAGPDLQPRSPAPTQPCSAPPCPSLPHLLARRLPPLRSETLWAVP
jgi:hypothetical protein